MSKEEIVSCPYFQPACPARELAVNARSCPQCLRPLKPCPACGTHNRAFANFCRFCRTPLSAAEGNWLSYRGGAQRLGVNTLPDSQLAPRDSFAIQEEDLKLELGDPCRSLLGYDRHLIAISQSGTIEIRDPALPTSGLRFKAEGPVSCEPCIDDGVLYLGSPGRLTAYSLGALTMTNPRLAPQWQLRLPGTPVQGLTAVAGHLYVTVVRTDMRREVLVIDDLKRHPPAAGRVLCVSAGLSWTAADSASQAAVFFSQEGESLQLHRVAHDGSRAELATRPLTRTPRPLADNVPIAFLGGKVFGVFGDEDKLCRIDADSGELEQSLGDDTKMFSLSQDGERGWDGDGVQIFSNGILFLGAARTDFFTPLDRVVKGSPVLLQGRAAVLGMLDGRLRIYDLLRLPRYDQLRLTGAGEPITSLVSFQRYLAVGNVKGVVKLLSLQAKPAA
jgi:putative pyrroloquinoline-quinone-binding quinoprotein